MHTLKVHGSMKRILVTGAAGQIGSELVPSLRSKFGDENVIAASHNKPLANDITNTGPHTRLDVTNWNDVDTVVQEYSIDTIYHLSSILSALAEQNRDRAYSVNFTGLHHVLEASLKHNLERVIVPSSIAAFGPETPRDKTPNETIQKPNTIYGISKVFSELMGNYYESKHDLDVRGVRLPGIISWKVEPTAGTTDYAVAIFYGAIKENRYKCFLRPDSYLPMMYIPDAISALMDLATADRGRLNHHSDYNVNSMSFSPSELADAISKRFPKFEMDYEIDLLRQSIADSWPNSLDDTVARLEWDWKPRYDLDNMVDDMIKNLDAKLAV